MSDNDVPAAPDYSPIIAAMNQIADFSNAQAKESLDWAKEQWANNKGLIDQINTGLLDYMNTSRASADAARARADEAWDAGRAQLDEALDQYTDPAKKASRMGAAQAQVGQAFEEARNSSTRELESYGVNPSSTRFAALDLGLRAQQAAAQAGAGNMSSRTDEDAANNVGKSILDASNSQYGVATNDRAQAMQAGASAVANTTGLTTGEMASRGTGLQWTGQGTGALQGVGNTMNAGYRNQMDQYNAERQSSSGIGSLLGGIAGLGTNTLGGSAIMSLFEEGGVVPEDATTGGAIPLEASPSGGEQVDDVNAKLNAGEFVMPTDVVKWQGEKFFQDLIVKARKAKEQAGAKPEMAVQVGPPPTEPDFRSRPISQGALPL